MKIICNGEEREIASGSTVAELIADLGLKAGNVVVECNGRLLNRMNIKDTSWKMVPSWS